MRCPKCGYVSFDHNDSCPKCRRNLITERDQLNLPSYAPDPPYFLGRLLGESGEASVAYHSAKNGEFNVLEEELEFESEAPEVQIPAAAITEEKEIEIELESISDVDNPPLDQDHSATSTEADTLEITTSEQSEEDLSLDFEPEETLSDLEIEEPSVADIPQQQGTASDEPDSFVFEMEDITLDEPTPKEELDLELVEDDLSEVSIDVPESVVDEEDFTLEENVSFVDGITQVLEPVVSEETAPSTDAQEGPQIDSELFLNLEELKDDDLGQTDITIDEPHSASQKVSDGRGG